MLPGKSSPCDRRDRGPSFFCSTAGSIFPRCCGLRCATWQAGGAREGGSTITQQLARMMYLSQERTIKRKVQEAVLALWLEQKLGKQEILTRYLNTAYFGAGVYGADAAAKRYFGKTAKELSLAEAAMLAGLVRAPSALAPTRNLEVRDSEPVSFSTPWWTRARSRHRRRRPRAAIRRTCACRPDNPPGTQLLRRHAGAAR